jgi:hypothetical protein
MEFEATAARDHAETMEFLSANLRKTDLIDQTLHDHADSQQEIMAMLQQALTTGKTVPTQQEGLREVCRSMLSLAHTKRHLHEHPEPVPRFQPFRRARAAPGFAAPARRRGRSGGPGMPFAGCQRFPVQTASQQAYTRTLFSETWEGCVSANPFESPFPTGRLSCILTWHAVASTWVKSG